MAYGAKSRPWTAGCVPTGSKRLAQLADGERSRSPGPAGCRAGPSGGRPLELPQAGDPRHRRRLDLCRDGDPARGLRGADLRRQVESQRGDAGARQQRGSRRLPLRLALARSPCRPDRAPGDLPVLDPLVRVLHRPDGALMGSLVGDDVPLPRRARHRRDARRRPGDADRVPAASAARAAARLPRLLVAGRASARHRPLLDLHRPLDRRRLELALALPRGLVPGLSGLHRAPLAPGEPLLPGAPRPRRGGGRGAHRDHRQARAGDRLHGARGDRVVCARARRAALAGRAVTTALIWIALNISYYGLFLWLPFVLRPRRTSRSTCTCS